MRNIKIGLSVMVMLLGIILQTVAQDVRKELKADANRSAGVYYALPVSKSYHDTPAPKGKHPYYFSHYGCPAAFYLTQSNEYKIPLDILAKADSLGKLTSLGRDVLKRLEQVWEDARQRSGEVKEQGALQMREQMKQLVRRFPEMFTADSYIDTRSIVISRNIQSCNEAMVELARHCHSYKAFFSSHRDRNWMNPLDDKLSSQRMDSLTMVYYNRFYALNTSDTRLMESLFSDQNYVVQNIDAAALSRALFRLAGSVQMTKLEKRLTLYDLFTPEEIYRHWRRQNAWNYISYGNCTLNGGKQPYIQRETLWNMLHMGDSVLTLDHPVVHLRYTHENAVMSLASLMELDGCGVSTSNLDSLELYGWVNYRIAPLGGRIELIHYRSGPHDKDPLVKVLLNGREARLPVQTNCAPYYHWYDVKRYYLRKLYRYENARNNEKDQKK